MVKLVNMQDLEVDVVSISIQLSLYMVLIQLSVFPII